MRRIFINTHSKYKNVTCKCQQGHIHDSRAEATYCNQLNILKRAGEIKDYEIQKTYRLNVNGKHITNHRVDFGVVLPDDKIEIHEYKGYETDVWRIKKKLFEACYPDIPYVVVK